jgi:hypothetical protein
MSGEWMQWLFLKRGAWEITPNKDALKIVEFVEK